MCVFQISHEKCTHISTNTPSIASVVILSHILKTENWRGEHCIDRALPIETCLVLANTATKVLDLHILPAEPSLSLFFVKRNKKYPPGKFKHYSVN